MKVRLARLHAPVTALGPGARIGVWFQGCSIGCRGCISRDTWDAADAALTNVDDVVAWIVGHADDQTIGVTLTGGEPSEQPEALAALLAGIADPRAANGWDVLCYTGVEEDEFARRCPAAYASVDVLVTGPYRASQPTDLVWRGSANQTMVLRTELGRRRYAEYVGATTNRPSLQLEFDGAGAYLIGVPRSGDMNRVQRLLAKRGVDLGGVSWRPPAPDDDPPTPEDDDPPSPATDRVRPQPM